MYIGAHHHRPSAVMLLLHWSMHREHDAGSSIISSVTKVAFHKCRKVTRCTRSLEQNALLLRLLGYSLAQNYPDVVADYESNAKTKNVFDAVAPIHDLASRGAHKLLHPSGDDHMSDFRIYNEAREHMDSMAVDRGDLMAEVETA